MRKLSKKISMLMVLAMLVSLFSGIVSASAASAWSFKSSKYDVDVNETIEMEKNEYADFDLLKEDVEVTKATYTVKWASSDEDVVWVNAKTGQLRADKFGKDDVKAGDKAKISATFTNVATKKSATRSFYIVIADDTKYEITADIADEAYVVGEKYALAAKVTADGKDVAAEVAFTVDGVAATEFAPAKAGEYTIIATATVDGKEVASETFVATAIEGGLVAAKQTKYDAVALTFGNADVAKAVAADFSKLGSVYLIGENEYQAFVKEVAVDKNNACVVNVTLFNSLMQDITYKFTYGDKSATVVGVDTNKFSSIAIFTQKVAWGSSQQVQLALYNADGVLVQIVNGGFGLEAISSGEYTVPYMGTSIHFHMVGKSATVKATYWMGYDNNGVKVPDLTATGTIVSVDYSETKESTITEWALGSKVETKVETVSGTEIKVSYSNGNFSTNATATLHVGQDKRLEFKYNTTNVQNGATWPSEWRAGNTDLLKKYVLTFESTNPHVALVDSSSHGQNVMIYPVGAGSTQIIVYRALPWALNNREVMGIFTVNVVGQRLLASANPTLSKRLLSSDVLDNSIMLKPNAVDQVGATYETGNFYLKLMNVPQNGVRIFVTGNNGTQELIYDDKTNNGMGKLITTKNGPESGWAPYFTVTATGVVDNDKSSLVQIGITTQDTITYSTMLNVVALDSKKPNAGYADGYRYAFDGVTSAIDMNVTKAPWNGMGQFATTLKLSIYDGEGYLVDVKDAADFKAGRKSVNTGEYFYTVTRDGWQDTTANYAGDNLFEAVSVSGGVLSKYDKGTYAVVAYKKGADKDGKDDRYLGTTNIVVSDSTAAITAVKKDNKITITNPATATTAQVIEAILPSYYENGVKKFNYENIVFTRGGNGFTPYDVVNAQYSFIANNTQVYVTKLYVQDKNDLGIYTYEVPVALTYTIQ